MKHKPYTYKAVCTHVYDGDTITVDINLGFEIIMHGQKLRLFGIDTPEIRGPEKSYGLIARDIMRETVLGKDVTIETIRDKTGKYGRWLAIVWIDDVNVNEMMIEVGCAKKYLP